jgi:predicted metal-binding transcription factor (methanogenesis marker protein 9)
MVVGLACLGSLARTCWPALTRPFAPKDLSLMDFKLENNSYGLIEDFMEDAKLMLDNCKLYNPESTVYHKTAIRMEKALQDILKSVGVDYRL